MVSKGELKRSDVSVLFVGPEHFMATFSASERWDQGPLRGNDFMTRPCSVKDIASHRYKCYLPRDENSLKNAHIFPLFGIRSNRHLRI